VGDIIQIYSIFDNRKLYIGYVIYCNDASFKVYIGDILKPITSYIDIDNNNYEFEVIGNVWDNPELIKECE